METLFDIANRMAQDLREYADAAEQAGSPQPATEDLLAEFDRISFRHMGMEIHQIAHLQLEGVS